MLIWNFSVSATEWLEEVLPNEPSWRVEETVKLAGILADHGVDLIDVSSCRNSAQGCISLSVVVLHINNIKREVTSYGLSWT